MAVDCNHDCSSCKSKCEVEYLPLQEGSTIKKIIGVVSGKGGVGKSLVTSLMASRMAREGYKVGILDADLTGPSIPKAFGLKGMLEGDGKGIFPAETKEGIKVVSVNLLVEDETNPIIYRGPALSGLVSQMYKDVYYGDLDYLFIDMPPGTADVNLTILKQIPLTGLIIVSTPQDLVRVIVEKSLKMADILNVPVLGLVENMSYMLCPHCNEKVYPFGQSHANTIVQDFNIPLLAEIPINQEITKLVDSGNISSYFAEEMDVLVSKISI